MRTQVEAGRRALDSGGTLDMTVLHVHDEATMRLKSFVKDDAGLTRSVARSRASSIQNSVISSSLQRGPWHPWIVELQALQGKGGDHLASALLMQLEEIIKCVPKKVRRIRVVHILAGDGIGTNENAAKRVLAFVPARWPEVEYMCVSMKCASHQANLAMAVAVAGQAGKRSELSENDLCANVSRLCKYVLADAGELLLHRLRVHLLQTTRFVTEPVSPEAATALRNLQALYGHGVIADDLVRVRPFGLAASVFFFFVVMAPRTKSTDRKSVG